MVFASQTVHVTSDAMASPTMTPCTTMSALTNMFQGDRLRGSSAASVAANAVPGSTSAPIAAATAAVARLRTFVPDLSCCMTNSRLTIERS